MAASLQKMNDRDAVRRINALAPGARFEFQGDDCTAARLTSPDDVYFGTIRRSAVAVREEVVGLVLAMESLRTLDLRKNRLGSIREPASASRLSHLDLASNYLGRAPDWLARCHGLRYLDLGVNDLTEFPPLAPLRNLEVLKIHKNRIPLYPQEMGEINIKTLNLYMNHIRRFPATVFLHRAMADFSWGISGVQDIPEEIGQWSSLRFFTFVGTKIGTLPDSFCSLSSLEGARLHKNRITSLPERFGDLTTLRDLTLYGNRLHSLPSSFDRLRLQRLNLANNRFPSPPRIHAASLWTRLE